ncbi:MAG: hypothetical protein ACXWJ5_03940 [Xanthobacteraceae bacterium]
MLRKIAVALIAATVIAAPALARTGSVAAKPATIGATAMPAKATAPVKFVRHIKKHKRHRHVVHVRHIKGGKVVAAKTMSGAPALSAKRHART